MELVLIPKGVEEIPSPHYKDVVARLEPLSKETGKTASEKFKRAKQILNQVRITDIKNGEEETKALLKDAQSLLQSAEFYMRRQWSNYRKCCKCGKEFDFDYLSDYCPHCESFIPEPELKENK